MKMPADEARKGILFCASAAVTVVYLVVVMKGRPMLVNGGAHAVFVCAPRRTR